MAALGCSVVVNVCSIWNVFVLSSGDAISAFLWFGTFPASTTQHSPPVALWSCRAGHETIT